MKKKTIIILVILIILISTILFLLLNNDKKFTVTFDTDSVEQIPSIDVKNKESIKLPEIPTKEGYTFIGWVDENNNLITKETKINKNTILKAKWIINDVETVTVKYEVDGNMNEFILEKNSQVLIPMPPQKQGYIFSGWLTDDGFIITSNTIINKDMILKANWIKKDVQTFTITYDIDDSTETIITESNVVLPVPPEKNGYVFAGWIDNKGNIVTKDTIITKNITVKALWKEPFTCPSDCTPIEDGSKCTKELTENVINSLSCPYGYVDRGNICINFSDKYMAFSLDYAPFWGCNDNDYKYDEEDGSGGAIAWCAKTSYKVTSSYCPTGYTLIESMCKKVETIDCIAN